MDSEYTDKFLATARPSTTDASDDPQTVLHAAYAAIIRGDFDALGESMTDDVELNICGFPATDGSWRGRNDVIPWFQRHRVAYRAGERFKPLDSRAIFFGCRDPSYRSPGV
jgi:hypothetical protein